MGPTFFKCFFLVIPPLLTNVSALPGETRTPEIGSLQSCCIHITHTDCCDDAGDFGVSVAAGACQRLEGAVPQEQAVLVVVGVRQNEAGILLLRDGHVEADVGHLHDVPRAGV